MRRSKDVRGRRTVCYRSTIQADFLSGVHYPLHYKKKAEYKIEVLKHQQYYGLLLNSMLKKIHQKKFSPFASTNRKLFQIRFLNTVKPKMSCCPCRSRKDMT